MYIYVYVYICVCMYVYILYLCTCACKHSEEGLYCSYCREERDVTAGKLNQLQEASEQIRMQLSAAQQEKSLLESSGQQKSSQLGDLTTEMDALRADNAAKQKDLTEKTGMITKVRVA